MSTDPRADAARVLAEHAAANPRRYIDYGETCKCSDKSRDHGAHQAAMLAAAGLLVPDPVDDDALVEAVAKHLFGDGPSWLDGRHWKNANGFARDHFIASARRLLASPALRARLAAGDDAQALARVLALHAHDGHPTHPCCSGDGLPWPCATARAARSAATTDEETR